ncbi:MAG TPA: hypothetical protein VLQ48_09815 [Chloroflexia bacterium]|nr:hypothetical protein [Chloroflexia bacterium]
MRIDETVQNETCPRCGNALARGAVTCPTCGLTVAPANKAGEQGQAPVPYAMPGSVPTWATPVGGQSGPAAGVAVAPSIVIALTPSRPATWAFWVGLVMSLSAIVFAICPLLLAMAFALDPQSDDPASFLGSGLLVSSCVVLGLLLPGLAMLFAGRPRRV